MSYRKTDGLVMFSLGPFLQPLWSTFYFLVSPILTSLVAPVHGPTHTSEELYVTKGKILALGGGTGIIQRLSSNAVMQTPIPNPFCKAEEEDHRRNMRLEAKVYTTIGEHLHVPKLIHWDAENCCLTMDIQATKALILLHSFQVAHCDLSPRNILLDSHLNIKIADFGGASLCGTEPSATSATRFRHPGYDWDSPPLFGDDIFSLGSLIYLIMTGSYPYEDVISDEVEKLFEAHQFPDVSSLVCGTIILQGWHRQVDSAQAIYTDLTAIETEHSA
ncbi:kinase-like domain-containing protein [Aspergillus pseudonomiae]|nr:kinase-like domain-containing protein [Aspergillus pseudonomiae]